MGLGDFFSGIKNKVKDVALDKALENMRDLKMPVKEGVIEDMLETHVNGKYGIKKANVDLSRDGIDVKVTFEDDRPTLKRHLNFEKMVWLSHKKGFNFTCTEAYDAEHDFPTYACVAVTLAALLRQIMGLNEKKNPYKAEFSTEIGGDVEGVRVSEGVINFDIRRVPLLRQYAYYRIMGQCPLEHLNVVDCWLESGKFIVRIDNNALVEKIKSMNLTPEQMRELQQGLPSEEEMAAEK